VEALHEPVACGSLRTHIAMSEPNIYSSIWGCKAVGAEQSAPGQRRCIDCGETGGA